jgi:hypothetical protein
MGWSDSHLHSFNIGEDVYMLDDGELEDDEIDESEASVLEALDGVKTFTYEYDFGDSWIHEVIVEDQRWVEEALEHAVCLDGENACPPEDCGGPEGYKDLQVAGPGLHPTSFDLVAINLALRRL